MSYIRPLVFVACLALGCFACSAHESVTLTTIADLSKNPSKFDGRLVRVRALLERGWEGDDFLSDSATPVSHPHPHVWFYVNPGYERLISGAVGIGFPNVLGTFTGYFHFVPNQKSRTRDVFDPGPFQLEVIAVSNLTPEHQP
jgi:hypothetical protein